MIDLKPFCAAPRDPRAYLHKPFRYAGHIYATDGAIAIRIADHADIEADTLPADKQDIAKKLQSWIDTAGGMTNYKPLTAECEDTRDQCAHCNGSGHTRDCPECDGEGEFEHGSHTYQCEECDGDGTLPGTSQDGTCACCWGSGKSSFSKRVEPDPESNAGYQSHLLLQLKQLPDIEFAVGEEDAAGGFRFTGGAGVIMPLRR